MPVFFPGVMETAFRSFWRIISRIAPQVLENGTLGAGCVGTLIPDQSGSLECKKILRCWKNLLR